MGRNTQGRQAANAEQRQITALLECRIHSPPGRPAPDDDRQLGRSAGVAALPWNQWQHSRGMGGRLRLESVAGLVWNTQ